VAEKKRRFSTIDKQLVPALSSEGEEQYQEHVAQDLQSAEEQLAKDLQYGTFGGDASWRRAASIVRDYRPVPWLFWVIIRSVYGKRHELGNPDPLAFFHVRTLLKQAIQDPVLGDGTTLPEDAPAPSLVHLVGKLGSDVCAALCFMHAVCRRVSSSLSERVWRPILDDALLRALIGYYVGSRALHGGAGRGMLAGFSSRSGLAIQIASGKSEQAKEALSGLAAGLDMRKVCFKVYGCDPLQVAALALIAGGCNRESAEGISSFEKAQVAFSSDDERFVWYSLFSIVEKLRMGRGQEVEPRMWQALSLSESALPHVMKKVQEGQRRGHGWRWVTSSQLSFSEDYVEDDLDALSPVSKGEEDLES